MADSSLKYPEEMFTDDKTTELVAARKVQPVIKYNYYIEHSYQLGGHLQFSHVRFIFQGDCLLLVTSSQPLVGAAQFESSGGRVVAVDRVTERGYFAPLTDTGNIVVEGCELRIGTLFLL